MKRYRFDYSKVMALLAEYGWSQADLVRRMGVDYVVLQSLRQGRNPNMQKLFTIAAALDVPVEELVTVTEEKQPDVPPKRTPSTSTRSTSKTAATRSTTRKKKKAS